MPRVFPVLFFSLSVVLFITPLESQETPAAAWGMDFGRFEYVPHGFYALGWAPDGRFAYATFKNFSEASGPMIEVIVIVQNMVTDEQLARLPLFEQRDREPTFDEAWSVFGDQIRAFLADQEIEYEPTGLSSFPLAFDGHSFSAEARTREKTDLQPGEEDFGTIDSYEVWIARRDGAGGAAGEKRITTGRWTGSVGGFLSVSAVGHFPNPYEPRTAVLIVETIRGWEGPPHEMRYRVAGSHLRLGF